MFILNLHLLHINTNIYNMNSLSLCTHVMLNMFKDGYVESNNSNVVNIVRSNTDIYGNIIKDFFYYYDGSLHDQTISAFFFSYLLNRPYWQNVSKLQWNIFHINILVFVVINSKFYDINIGNNTDLSVGMVLGTQYTQYTLNRLLSTLSHGKKLQRRLNPNLK